MTLYDDIPATWFPGVFQTKNRVYIFYVFIETVHFFTSVISVGLFSMMSILSFGTNLLTIRIEN